ncbi:hypothetical protein [Thalassotalea maritima]|uniref:hypothetical protein n=1 Tax=Thalassotalea maritima TaxID=3242416 RepID=UPI00352813B5
MAAQIFSELVEHYAHLIKSDIVENVILGISLITRHVKKVLTITNVGHVLASMPLPDFDAEANLLCGLEDDHETLATKASPYLREQAEEEFSGYLDSEEIFFNRDEIPYQSGVEKLVRRKQFIGSLAQAKSSCDFEKEMELIDKQDKFAHFPMPASAASSLKDDIELICLSELKKIYLESEYDIDWERWQNSPEYRGHKDNDRAKKMYESLNELEFYLGNRQLHQYKKRDFKGLFKLMLSMPKARAKVYANWSLSDLEAKDWTKFLNKDGRIVDITLQLSTVDKHRQRIRQVFKWVLEQLEDIDGGETIIKRNPVPSQPPVSNKQLKEIKGKPWARFSESDLASIWQCDAIIQPEKDWHYWIPVLLRTSGARPNEICQLAIQDIYFEDVKLDDDSTERMCYLKVTEQLSDQSVKNSQSTRDIPLHPIALKLGFEAFYNRQKSLKSPHRSLWTDLKVRAGYYSTNYREWFNKYILDNTEVIKERFDEDGLKKVPYSFRSTFITSFREQGLAGAISSQLVGHIDQSTTRMTENYTKPFYRKHLYLELKKDSMEDLKLLKEFS